MENICILALSALLGKYNESELKLDEKYIKYIYQLEPIPIKLSRELESKNSKLDTILAFSTTETSNTLKRVKVCEEGKEIEYSSKEMTAEEFFKCRMTECGLTETEVVIFRIEDTSKPQGAVLAVLDYLLERGKDNINVWVDNHGGKRDIQVIVQALVSLLKFEGIKPKDVYGIEYLNNKCIIQKAYDSFEINDFVTGINEFLNYGRSKNLESFFNEEKDNDIVFSIREISDAILLCDMVRFENSLNLLATAMEKREVYDEESGYLKLLIKEIKGDYGILLDKEKRGNVDVIDWCLKKEFYQQALTIIESKMGRNIINNKTLKFDWDDVYHYASNKSIYLKTIVDMSKKEWEEKENFFIQKFAYGAIIDNTKTQRNKYNYMYDDVLINNISGSEITEFVQDDCYTTHYMELSGDLYNEYDKNRTELYKREGINGCINKYTLRLGFKDVNNQYNKFNIPVKVAYKDDMNKEFQLFLKLHMSLKNQRNETNHSAINNRLTLEQISDAINLYCRLARELGINRCPESMTKSN